MRRALPLFAFIAIASCQQAACPSGPGGPCNPRDPNCPEGYTCALAEICTHACEQASDCWVRVGNGCRITCAPGQRLSDGGFCTDQGDGEYCPETLTMECVSGYCQLPQCLASPCDYDLYGPSDWKGNRDQGPQQ